MTSALRGRGVSSKAEDSTDRLREWDNDKGQGVQKSQISADFICERPRRRRRGESEGVCVKPRKREGGIAARHLGQAQVHR